jgi:shikimate kinase
LIACSVITALEHLKGAAKAITGKNKANVSVVDKVEARSKLQKIRLPIRAPNQ